MIVSVNSSSLITPSRSLAGAIGSRCTMRASTFEAALREVVPQAIAALQKLAREGSVEATAILKGRGIPLEEGEA
jgi:hypothetical protein